MSILIAPATSRTCSYVVSALLSSPSPLNTLPPLCLLAHSPTSLSRLQKSFPLTSLPPGSAYVVADFMDPQALKGAMSGVDTVFLNLPVSESEVTMGCNVVDAAKAEGNVKSFVFASALHPYVRKIRHHIAKLEVEEYLFESGLTYTILQPTHLMQNTPIPLILSSPQPTLALPYSSAVLQGFLDLADFSIVASRILLDPKPHALARYELVNQNLTYDGAAEVITNAAREAGVLKEGEVKCTKGPREGFVEIMKGIGFVRDEYGVKLIEEMCDYYDRQGVTGNSNTLRWLLGREPSTWEDYARREIGAMKAKTQNESA